MRNTWSLPYASSAAATEKVFIVEPASNIRSGAWEARTSPVFWSITRKPQSACV
ncbi:MAG: hypothetical protein R2726_12800 [Acidimicrobiales bacterium]